MADFSPQEWRERLKARPLPNDGSPPPWEVSGGEDGYVAAAESLAHAFLVLCDERPELLRFESEDSSWVRADNDKLWQAFKDRWPEGDAWLGGITGFQFGWAHNIVRYVVGVDAVGNPALITVREQ